MPSSHDPHARVLAYGSLLDLAHAVRVAEPGRVLASAGARLDAFSRAYDVLGANRPHQGHLFYDEAGGRPEAVAWMGARPAAPGHAMTVRELLLDAAALAALDAHEWQYRRFPLPRALYRPVLEAEPEVPTFIYRASRGCDPTGWARADAEVVIDRGYLRTIERALRLLGAPDEAPRPDHPIVDLAWRPVITPSPSASRPGDRPA